MARDPQTPQDPSSRTESRQAYQNTSTGSYFGETEMGNDSRGWNGHVGKIEGPSDYHGKTKMGDNGRNFNGNVVNGAEIKASGFWEK